MSATRVLLKTDRPITSMALSDQSCLVVGLENNTILLRTQNGIERLHTLQAARSGLYALAFSPNGHLLAYGSFDDTVGLWDTQTKEEVAMFQGDDRSFSVAFSPDGRLLASASRNRSVRLWDVVERKEKAASPVGVMEGHTASVRSVSFSPDGRQLASGSFDGTVRLWRVPDGVPGSVLQHACSVYCVAFSPVVGSNMLASGGDDGTIKLWDVSESNQQQRKPMRELQGHSDWIMSVAFSPDGSQLVSGSYDRTVRLWSAASGKLLKTLEGHSDIVFRVAFYPNGKQVASCSDDDTVRMWTVCEWSDRTHYLFGEEMKRIVFYLMCIKEKLESSESSYTLPQLPIVLWLEIYCNFN
jgi:WD40 repeat protein